MTGYLETTKGGRCFYQSSYEKRFLEILDADPDVTSFFVHPFKIRYKYNGSYRTYIPDCLVRLIDGREYLVEIKPSRLMDEDLVIRKAKAGTDIAERYGMKYLMLTEYELFSDKVQRLRLFGETRQSEASSL